MRTLHKSGQAVQCLIIDDDNFDAEALKHLLKKARIGNQVTHAADAHHALKTLQAWEDTETYPPVLVFLDLDMPRMSGAQLMARLALEPFAAQLHVLVVSSSAQIQDEHALSQYANILGNINKKDLSNSFIHAFTQLSHVFELKSA